MKQVCRATTPVSHRNIEIGIMKDAIITSKQQNTVPN